MNELSVNISGTERQKIERKAIRLFLKTAKARHPDEHFYKNLTKRIYESAIEKFNYLSINDSIAYPQLNFVYKNSVSDYLCRLTFPDDMYVLNLINTDRSNVNLAEKSRYLSSIDVEDLVIPLTHTVGRKVLFPFKSFGNDVLELSQEIKDDINLYNASMEDTYTDLNNQLRVLIATISQCKTTKTFYAKLPNLTSLFPSSLQEKIRRKNDVGEVELTEEEKLRQEATNAIATANLLED